MSVTCIVGQPHHNVAVVFALCVGAIVEHLRVLQA
jgi:hypothetical protein